MAKKINLLPEEYKKILRIEKARVGVMICGAIFILFLVLFAGGLFLMVFYAKESLILQSKELTLQRLDPEISKYYALREEIETINQQTREILELSDRFVGFSGVMNLLSDLTPRGIRFDDISFSSDRREMRLAGTSGSRDLFLEFETNLKTSNKIQDLRSPIENILKSKDITFTITFRIK